MVRSAKSNMIEGIVTFLVGLGLRLFMVDVTVGPFTLSKVGVAIMCVGGAIFAFGLFQTARNSLTSKGS